MNVVVIGSGISGLTSAALLAGAGNAVTIYEQFGTIGGVTATVEQDGFRWDLGPMMVPDFGPGEPARLVLDDAGVSRDFAVRKSFRGNVFRDFEVFRPEKPAGLYGRKDRLAEIFPDQTDGLERYYRFHERMQDLFFLYGRPGITAKMKFLSKFLPVFGKRNWSAQRLMDDCFTDERIKTAFIGMLADYTTRPDEFPAIFVPFINPEACFDERTPLDYPGHEHRSSWMFVLDGMESLVNALARSVTQKGGVIRTGVAVKKIVMEGGKVKGAILSDGTRVPADAVIASGGAQELFLDLVGREHLKEDFLATYVDGISVTDSAFMVHLGVDFDPTVHQHGAPLCYYYMTYDIHGCIEELESNVYHEGRDGFLVYCLSAHSPEMAPPGHHAVTVYTIAPNFPTNGSWSKDKEHWADKLVEHAEKFIPGLRKHTKTRVIITPEDFRRRTHLKRHAFGGCTPRIGYNPPTHRTPIEGLWLVGAQSENFGGVAPGIIGAGATVKQILKGQSR
jgi:phytoene dehydrogenase-like protein